MDEKEQEELEQAEEENEEAEVEEESQTPKTLLGKIGKVAKAIIGFVISNFFTILIVGIIILVISLAISFVTSFFDGGYDSSKGTMNPRAGIKGDKFYGARAIYYDNSFASEDLSNTYLDFTYNLLYNINNAQNGISLSINFSTPANQNTDIQTIATNFAKMLAGMEDGYSLYRYALDINNYGFTAQQSDAVLDSIATTLKDNNLIGQVSKTQVLAKLVEEYKTEAFSYMKNVCKKIIVKDYLCNETEGLKDVAKHNFIGYIFMPKENITIKESSQIIVVDQKEIVDFSFNYKNQDQTQILASDSADMMWYDDLKTVDTNLESCPIEIFNAINKENVNYLSQPKSLFALLKEGTFNTYFNISKQEIEDGALINDQQGENPKTCEDNLLDKINTQNYLYFKFDADAPFNTVDTITEY